MKMNYLPLVRSLFTVGLVGCAIALPAQNLTTFRAQPNASKMTLDGSSSVHDWTVKSEVVGGAMELDSAFVTEPQKASPGKINAKANVRVPVSSLHGNRKGMDTFMYETMKLKDHKNIEYRLSELTLKEAPQSADGPFQFESKGELTIAGVTNKISMPVTMTREEKTKMKTTGSISLKMTSFGMKPPSPPLLGSLIKTGDDVKLTFEWLTAAVAAK